MALRRSSQRQVTGLPRHEPVVHQAIERNQQHEQEGEFEVLGNQKRNR